MNIIRSCGILLLGIMIGILLKQGHHHHWFKKGLKAYHTTYLSTAQQKAFYTRYQPGPDLITTNHNKDIPRLIHFIWVSKQLSDPEHLPLRVKKNIEGWAKLNPNMRIVLWTNQSVQKYFPELVAKFHQITPPALIADILRYKILDQFGGLYLDTDIVALKSVVPLLKKTRGFTVCEKTRTKKDNRLFENDCLSVCNAVIATHPKDPMIHSAFQHSIQHVEDLDAIEVLALSLAGPPVLTHVVHTHHFPILQQQTFYPCLWNQKEQCNKQNFSHQKHVYGMHTWQNSWK